MGLEILIHGEQCRLGIERIENGFDQQDIRTAIDQAANGFGIIRHQLIESNAAETRVIYIRGDRCRLGRRPQHARDKARFFRRFRLHRLRCFPREFGAGKIEFVYQILHVVIRHRGGGGIEGVGLDDIRTRFQIGIVDGTDNLRLGERQKIVIAFDVMGKIGKASATIIRFVEPVALDHGSHGAVQQHNAACEDFFKQFGARSFVHGSATFEVEVDSITPLRAFALTIPNRRQALDLPYIDSAIAELISANRLCLFLHAA